VGFFAHLRSQAGEDAVCGISHAATGIRAADINATKAKNWHSLRRFLGALLVSRAPRQTRNGVGAIALRLGPRALPQISSSKSVSS